MHHYIWQNKNWTNFNWQEEKLLSVLSQTRLNQGKLISKIKALGIDDATKAQAEILIAETVKTAQIEGEQYDLNEVRSSVNRRLGLSFAGLPESKRHIEGLVEVLLDATSNFNRPLTIERLKSWQAALFPTGLSGLRKIRVGEFRDDSQGPMQVVSGPIGREKVHYQAPPAYQLDQEMINFLSWWEQSLGKIDGLIRAGIAHFFFVTIHPFEDGNGRIARALTDMALAQDDDLDKRYYSFSEQIVSSKQAYYQVLEKAQQVDTDITEWLVWFANCFNESLSASGNLLESIFTKVNFWQKHFNIELSSHQKKVINKLLDVGKVNFQGSLTTRKYVSLTKVSRATAYREINDLLKKGILKQNHGKGRSASYDINW